MAWDVMGAQSTFFALCECIVECILLIYIYVYVCVCMYISMIASGPHIYMPDPYIHTHCMYEVSAYLRLR